MKNIRTRVKMPTVTRTALAAVYDISRKTLYNWLKKAEISIREGCQICWADQQKIHKMFGDPEEYKLHQKEKAQRIWQRKMKFK